MNYLSFIIPVYNVEKYISNTLQSLINQTEKGFEVIIVNDGSTDNTSIVVNNLIKTKRLNNFKLINKENGGVSSAKNLGLKEAKGKYVIFLDGDDFVAPNLVEILLKQLNLKELDVICWGYNIVREDKTTVSKYFDKYCNLSKNILTGKETLGKYLEKRLHICTISAAYKRDLLIKNNLYFTEGCSSGEDVEFILKTIFSANKVFFVNDVLSYYLIREGSTTNSYSVKRFDAINAVSRAFEYIRNKSDEESFSNKLLLFENEYILRHFFSNFYSCFFYLLCQKGFNVKRTIEYIHSDLDHIFPNLLSMIKKRMKSYSGNDLKLKIRILGYLYFPTLFYWTLYLKNKLKGI